MDETEYLLSSPANAERLKISIEQVKNNQAQEYGLIEIDDDEYQLPSKI